MLVGILLASPALASDADTYFPQYSDGSTALLWLFDEPLNPADPPVTQVTPWYYNQTILDASDHYYDLVRLHGGATEPGRFGRALRIRGPEVGPGMQLATNFASEPRVFGVFTPADHEFVPGSEKERESIANYFWYTAEPEAFVNALHGNAWTIETWVRLAGPPETNICLVDAGQGQETTLKVELIDGVSVARITVPEAGIEVNSPLPKSNLNDGQWHHLAWVKPAGKNEILAYVDGKQASATPFQAAAGEDDGPSQPGLVERTFSELEFRGAGKTNVVSGLGKPVAEAASGAISLRLRGWIKAPHTGEVRFESEPDSGLHLDIDHRPLIYGWFGRAALYRRSPRWGKLDMVAGELYPVLIEMQLGEGDVPFAKQTLTWSWDGAQKEPIPESAWVHSPADLQASDADQGDGFTPKQLMRTRYNFTLGSDRQGNEAMDGWLDELRVSNVARYSEDFEPITHSMNYGANAPVAAEPNGPPLLFGSDQASGPVQLGTRKYVFIDNALIDQSSGLEFKVNPPHDPQRLEPTLPGGDHSFFDLQNRVALFAPAGYEGREDYAFLWVSDDGIHFKLHKACAPKSGGGDPEPIQTRVPAWGRMAQDTNPNTPAWARFKYTAGVPNRGICLLVSPDAVHWRRNEAIMLQAGTGGESHWFWDDQAGKYRYLLKWDHGPGGRQSVEAVSNDFYSPWPLPNTGDVDHGLMTPEGYMPTRIAPDDVLGEVYRSRAVKYPWAPDTYVAFVWRFDRQTNARQVELAVSRDGENWKYYSNDWYMPAEFEFQGNEIHEVTSVDGMIRRGDELWQYADYSTGRHDGRAPSWRVRVSQRLDGFVSLDAGEVGGEFVTKPIVFSGETLKLNVAVQPGGKVRMALVDQQGNSMAGFGIDDCDPITADATDFEVSWSGNKDLSVLAGQSVRVQCQMKNAKLYALQFE
jgi:hypothetical protein